MPSRVGAANKTYVVKKEETKNLNEQVVTDLSCNDTTDAGPV